ncbi:hypothetical protein BGW39_005976 [Mortierella sp. 14UC]|nr:hypothetical protein BGW39_005976 [Mortierella sp. 14UC]
MSRAAPGDKNTFGGINNSNGSPLKPKKLKFEAMTQKSVFREDIEVQGSDSGSDADWDDKDVYLSAASTPRNIPQETAPSIVNLSDDEIPTLSKFTSKKGAVKLDDSDSDFGEDPFAGMNLAPATSVPPSAAPSVTTTFATILPARAARDNVFDSDIELSESEDSDSNEGTDGGNRKRVRARTGSAAGSRPEVAKSRCGRTLRNTNPQPELDLDMPVLRASKYNKPTKKSFFSLDSLLKEKERRERVGYDLQAVKNHIALEDKELEVFDMNEEDLLAIPEGVFSEQQEANLREIIKDTHTQTVEDIAEFFIHWPQNLVVDPLEMHLTEADSVDHIVKKNQPVTLSVFSIIQKVLSQDLVRIFRMYGAKEEHLDEEWQVTPVTSDTKAERAIDPDTIKFPRQNLKAVLKMINLTATLDPQFYDNTEIRRITSLLLRMTTDPIIGDIKSLLGSTLTALLDAVPIHSWDAERNRICEETLKSLGTSAAFLLLTLHQLPSLSDRITLLRRSIALAYLKQPPIPAGQVAPDINELHRALFVDRELQALRNSDYTALGRRYQIYGFCLDDEQILAGYGRRDLELLSKKLQIIHGRISDAKAAHLDRTRTKEYIQRIVVRLEMVILQKESAQSTLGFAVQNNVSNNINSNSSSNSSNNSERLE